MLRFIRYPHHPHYVRCGGDKSAHTVWSNPFPSVPRGSFVAQMHALSMPRREALVFRRHTIFVMQSRLNRIRIYIRFAPNTKQGNCNFPQSSCHIERLSCPGQSVQMG